MNEVRKEKNKQLFIRTAYEIIEKEGIEAATLRNIAGKAGYNSATVYSYFSNLSDLILSVKLYYEEILVEKIKMEVVWESNSLIEIFTKVYLTIAAFYLEHPNAFECAYLSKLEAGKEKELLEARKNNSKLQEYCVQCYQKIEKEYKIEMQKIIQLNIICHTFIVGNLLLLVRNRIDINNKDALIQIELNIKRIILGFKL